MGWLRQLFMRQRIYGELSEEMRGHLEEKVEELVAGGMARREAEAAARREFGSVSLAEEDGREVWRWDLVESVWADVRFGARGLRKARGFAVVAVLTLGLGIGATTAIFSIIRAVLMNPLAMEEPRRVMVVRETWRETFASVSVGNFADVRRESGSFANLCALNEASFNLATLDAPVRVSGELATADCFATFGVAPMAGRFFVSAEDEPGREKVVLISERLWRTQLGGDPAIVGRALRINGVSHTVVGVMPKTFDPLLSGSELWIPQAFTSGQIADHDDHYLTVAARLKPGVSAEQAQAEMNVIAQRLQQAYPLDAGRRAAGVAVDVCGSGICVADRVREHREPAAGAGADATERDCAAHCAGGFAEKAGAATAGGERAAGIFGRNGWRGVGVLGTRVDCGARAR
jgi:putative ABC transport system permease protein